MFTNNEIPFSPRLDNLLFPLSQTPTSNADFEQVTNFLASQMDANTVQSLLTTPTWNFQPTVDTTSDVSSESSENEDIPAIKKSKNSRKRLLTVDPVASQITADFIRNNMNKNKRQRTQEKFWNSLHVKGLAEATGKPPIIVQDNRVLGRMESFSSERVADFKHLIYNLLVDNFNDPINNTFVQPFTVIENGRERHGFKFNEKDLPEKRLPELYALHIRKANLQLEDMNSVFVQDLYKFYLRACLELLSKYFHKKERYAFLYDDIPLFIPNGRIEDAEVRIGKMSTRQRKQTKSRK